jgi:hypothetical protein
MSLEERILQDHFPPALDEKTVEEIYAIAGGQSGSLQRHYR